MCFYKKFKGTKQVQPLMDLGSSFQSFGAVTLKTRLLMLIAIFSFERY